MSLTNLDRLVETRQLKAEAPIASEFAGLMSAGKKKLKDAELTSLSLESRFELSYSAAHSLALAALRWHGYRSENRYIVFQCLTHTTKLKSSLVRVLAEAHEKRNRISYEGEIDLSLALIESVIRVTQALLKEVTQLKAIQS